MCEPGLKVVVVKLAVGFAVDPSFGVSVIGAPGVPSTVNVTVPVGKGATAPPPIVAVNVTDCPNVEWLPDDITVVVVEVSALAEIPALSTRAKIKRARSFPIDRIDRGMNSPCKWTAVPWRPEGSAVNRMQLLTLGEVCC
jgi:hypothetical protein